MPATRLVADKVYLKDGKSLDGIVEAEYPTRIKFNFQGRGMFIERNRIDRIEKSDTSKNAEMLIQKAEEALAAGNGTDAVGILLEAGKIVDLTPAQRKLIDELRPQAEKLASMGSPEERKAKAAILVKQATEHFDKIETRQAFDVLFQAFELDPSNLEAHTEMSRVFDTPSPDLEMAADYFARFVDPETLDGEHKVVPLLTKVFETEAERMQESTDPREIEKHIFRLQKLSQAFEKRPAWALKATEKQKELIEKGSFGIVTIKVADALEKENYKEALVRLQALGGEKDRPELTNLYTSVYMGLGEFDKARGLLEYAKTQATDTAEVDRVLNALNIYTTAIDAREKGEHKEARQALNLLFEQRNELPREISALVARAKVGYDATAMEALESAEDWAGAANIAVQINSYSKEKDPLQTAAEVLSRVAPQLSFKLQIEWIVDETEIPIPAEWTEIVKQELTNRFAMQFDEASPFTLHLRILQGTPDKAGVRILAAVDNPDPYTIDYLQQDAQMTTMSFEFVISHELNPEIAKVKHEVPGLPEAVIKERELAADKRHTKGTIVYLDLDSLSTFKSFLSDQLGQYLPPELAVIATQMKLRPQMVSE